VNAGRDVERLISGWLAEEAPEHAPDRILAAAGRAIDRTTQRRWRAAWKEPTMSSTARWVAAAAVLVVAVAGAAWIGRSTAGVAAPAPTASPSPAATPTASPSGSSAATLATYRAARDAYCTPANNQLITLNNQGGRLNPAGSAADRAAMIGILQQTVALGDDEVAHLTALEPPASMAVDHAADVVHHQDSLAILREVLALMQAGKVTEANAVAEATVTLSSSEQAYEARYGLAACP